MRSDESNRSLHREDWIAAIQSVADRLQVLDESDLSPSAVEEMEAESSDPKNRQSKRKVVGFL